MIQNTATDFVPWFVVPADSKWFTRVVVAAAVIVPGFLRFALP